MKAPTGTVPLLLATLIFQTNGFTVAPSTSQRLNTKTTTILEAKKGPIEIPPNEFSRPLRTEILLGPRRKEYNIAISAEEEELEALAKRFSLSRITKLEADLTLRKDRVNGSVGVECIQVKGDIHATVTQTCVRTNEDFDVDLEFSLQSIVKSCGFREEEAADLGGMSAAQIEGALGGGASSKRKGKKKGGRQQVNMRESTSQSLNELRMKEIEDLLQDSDMEEDIVEDENIFGMDGMLDIGELVAQTFRLKLDPYPKKPGSGPVSYSITG